MAATGQATKNFTYKADNQITNTGYTYDQDGNVTATPPPPPSRQPALRRRSPTTLRTR